LLSRILIISTSREFAPQPTVPIGAAWVAEALQLAGFQVKFLDLCFVKNPITAIDHVLGAFNPDGIGVSVRNLDNCDFLSPKSFLPDLKQITDFIKMRSKARILLGGAGISIMPMQVLEYLELDHAIVGEGERAAVLFFRSERGREESVLIPGLVSRSAAKRREVCAERLLASDSVMPQMHNWIDTRRYLGFEPVLPVQGKRGCANRCLYCTYNMIEGGRWRLRETAAVVDEISIAIARTGAREFEFIDSVFNQPEGYLETLLEEILRRQLKAKFRVSSLSPKGLTKSQVTLMERAGMTSLVITPETASDVTLAALRKDFTEEEVIRAAELISGSSIKALWCFLLGGPKEDDNTLAKTIGFLNRNIGKKDAAFITSGIRIYPGTGLHEVAIEEGIVEASDDLLMPRFYFSPQISPQKARDMLQTGVSDLSRCIFLSDTRSGSIGPLRRLGTMLGLPSPFWRYASYMNWFNRKCRVIGRAWPPAAAPPK
jgi:anaerobic magnesium-protoporphyrin IX monomethyl ester cyclase